MKQKFITFVTVFISIYLNAQDCHVDEYFGEATYYDFELAGGFGNCSFDDTKIRPFLIGAMNELDYNQGDYCGACVEVQGPDGDVTVQIIDRCPECKQGDIDLSPEAFDYIAPRIDGRVDISWHLVPCPVQSNIRFQFKEGSSQYWSAIQVLNHRNKIDKLEVKQNGVYVNLPRQKYNYFLAENGLGTGPYEIRITDVFGAVVEENSIPLQLDKEIVGTQQFPKCDVLNLSFEDDNKSYYRLASNTLYLENRVSGFSITDITGRIVVKKPYQKELYLNLQSGVYILKFLSTSGEYITDKIFVD